MALVLALPAAARMQDETVTLKVGDTPDELKEGPLGATARLVPEETLAGALPSLEHDHRSRHLDLEPRAASSSPRKAPSGSLSVERRRPG